MVDAVYVGLAIAVMAAVTLATRALPFVFLRSLAHHPSVLYLGRYLPPAIMTLLVLYCVRDVHWLNAPWGARHLLAIGLTAGLHCWRRNALLSIAGGTGLFMWLTQSALLS